MAVMDVLVAAVFDVSLSSSASTGYQWQLEAAPDGVELVGSDVVASRAAPIGDAATQVFHLRAGRAGHYVLTFVLKRRWEATAIQTHQVEVQAR